MNALYNKSVYLLSLRKKVGFFPNTSNLLLVQVCTGQRQPVPIVSDLKLAFMVYS